MIADSSRLALLACACLLAGCAARHPPAIPAWQVAPDTPYLWPDRDGRAGPTEAAPQVEKLAEGPGVGIDNGLIAVVNNRVVTLKEFDYQFSEALRAGRRGDVNLFHLVLDSLVERLLLLEMAEKKGVVVDEPEVEAALEEQARRFPGGWTEFRGFLDENRQSLEEVRSRLKDSLVSEKLERELYAGYALTSPQELLAEYKARAAGYAVPETRDISLLLVFTENYRGAEAAKATASRYAAELAKGADFAELAKKHSEGPRKELGGRHGFVRPDDLNEAISKVAFGLASGATSGVEEMDGAFFIVRCHAVKAPHVKPYEEAQDELRQAIVERKRKERRDEVVKELLANASVRKLGPDDYLRYRGIKP